MVCNQLSCLQYVWQDVGKDGAIDPKSIPTIMVIYEFKPADFEDPILLYF